MRTVMLKSGSPDLDSARRRLLTEMEAARKSGVTVLKVVHGWGSSGEGGVLAVGIRRSLRLRVKDGRARTVVPGEQFGSDTLASRELLTRHPALRADQDFNRGNPGITIVEL